MDDMTELIDTIDHPDARALAYAADDGWVRDMLILRALGVTDRELLLRVATGGMAGEDYGELLKLVIPLREGCPAFRRILAEAADFGPGPKAVLAWLDWLDGDISNAAPLAVAAMTEAPAMPMPAFVWDMVRRGIRPKGEIEMNDDMRRAMQTAVRTHTPRTAKGLTVAQALEADRALRRAHAPADRWEADHGE